MICYWWRHPVTWQYLYVNNKRIDQSQSIRNWTIFRLLVFPYAVILKVNKIDNRHVRAFEGKFLIKARAAMRDRRIAFRSGDAIRHGTTHARQFVPCFSLGWFYPPTSRTIVWGQVHICARAKILIANHPSAEDTASRRHTMLVRLRSSTKLISTRSWYTNVVRKLENFARSTSEKVGSSYRTRDKWMCKLPVDWRTFDANRGKAEEEEKLHTWWQIIVRLVTSRHNSRTNGSKNKIGLEIGQRTQGVYLGLS